MTTFWDIPGVTCCVIRFLTGEGAIDYGRAHLYRPDKAIIDRIADVGRGTPVWREAIEFHLCAAVTPTNLYQLRIGIGHESRTVVYSDV